jgi:transcription antitermination factor NusG
MSNATISTGQHWYVLYTRSKFEKKIAKEIRLMNFEYYLPMQQVDRKWSDRIKRIEIPLFSNYIFVKTAPAVNTSLLNIPGTLKFVSFGGKPAYLPDHEIEKIRLIEANRMDIEKEPYYTTGDKVRITKGVFHGMEGVMIRKTRETRMVIRVALLKQAISFEVNEGDLEKVVV